MIKDVLSDRGYDVDNRVINKITEIADRELLGRNSKYRAAVVITTLGLCRGEIEMEKRKPPIEKWSKKVIQHLMEIADIVTHHDLKSSNLDQVDEDGEWEFFPYHTGFMALEEEAYLELVAQGIVED